MLFTLASHKVSIMHQCHDATALHLNNRAKFQHFSMAGPNFWPTLYVIWFAYPCSLWVRSLSVPAVHQMKYQHLVSLGVSETVSQFICVLFEARLLHVTCCNCWLFCSHITQTLPVSCCPRNVERKEMRKKACRFVVAMHVRVSVTAHTSVLRVEFSHNYQVARIKNVLCVSTVQLSIRFVCLMHT